MLMMMTKERRDGDDWLRPVERLQIIRSQNEMKNENEK